MAVANTIKDLGAAIGKRGYPAITRWNRLEGRPRTHDFDRALKAEVRDALWMLSRQWQMGEFEGDDAGSPVLARACIDVFSLDAFQAKQGAVRALSLEEPFEAQVEWRPLPLLAGPQYLSLDLRLLLGRRWLKLLKRDQDAARLTADYRTTYTAKYPVAVPNPEKKEDAAICAHADARQMAEAAAKRAMDGIAFLESIKAGNSAFDGIGAAAADQPVLTTLAAKFVATYASLFFQPGTEEDAWLPSRLEYQFGVSATESAPAAGSATESVMRAEEYYQGNPDWYTMERQPNEDSLGDPAPFPKPPERHVHTFIPASIVFEGMPSTRWWAFEDRRTNFGDVKPDKTDLGKLLFMEFALVYANDWFVPPYVLPIARLTEVKGVAVLNVFGERIWVEPIREQPSEGWKRWSMFTLAANPADVKPPPPRLLLLPTSPKVQESAPLEEIALVRDEMANMVWGLEKRILLPSGMSRPGNEAAREYRQYLQELIPKPGAPAAEAKAPIRYQVMNTVPEQWIPFIPVHIPNSTRETQLQRAALLRILEREEVAKAEPVEPRTTLLRFGLPKPYYVNEEEVPRAGAVITQTYQRTRWMGGKVVTWFGARKQTGRGEGSSGLAFDRVVDVKPKTSA